MKYKITIHKITQSSDPEKRYPNEEVIYEQTREREIDLIGIMKAFNTDPSGTIVHDGQETVLNAPDDAK